MNNKGETYSKDLTVTFWPFRITGCISVSHPAVSIHGTRIYVNATCWSMFVMNADFSMCIYTCRIYMEAVSEKNTFRTQFLISDIQQTSWWYSICGQHWNIVPSRDISITKLPSVLPPISTAPFCQSKQLSKQAVLKLRMANMGYPTRIPNANVLS